MLWQYMGQTSVMPVPAVRVGGEGEWVCIARAAIHAGRSIKVLSVVAASSVSKPSVT